MADTTSPAFMPPMNNVQDSDPMVVRVPLDTVDFAFRQSAAKSVDTSNSMNISHIKNGS